MILGKDLKAGAVIYEASSECEQHELKDLTIDDVCWSLFVVTDTDGQKKYSVSQTAFITKPDPYSHDARVCEIEPDSHNATTRAEAIRACADSEREYGELCLARAARLYALALEAEQIDGKADDDTPRAGGKGEG